MKKRESRCAFAVMQSLEPRQLLSGELDVSYGQYGYAITSVLGAESKFDAALTSDGKLLVLMSDGDWDHSQLLRFTTDGRIDASFGNAGKVALPFARQMDLDASGRIVVAGITRDDETLIVRLNPGGDVDTSFAAAGYVHWRDAELNGSAELRSLELESDG